MGADILIALVRRYLPQIIGAIVIIVAYFYWHHHVYSQGYDAASVEYEKRDADTERQSRELLKLKTHEHDVKLNEQNKRSMGAIETYANYSAMLHSQLADAQRVPVNTVKTSCNRNAVPGTGASTSAPPGASEEDVQQALSIKACELLIEQYLVPNSVIVK